MWHWLLGGELLLNVVNLENQVSVASMCLHFGISFMLRMKTSWSLQFLRIPLPDILDFKTPHPDSRISSDEAFVINGPMSNRGKKELLLDDVDTVFGGTLGKRAYPGDKKTNPKQKAGQPPTPINGYGNQSTRSLHPVQPSLNGHHHNGNDTRKDIRTISHPDGLQEMSKESSETIDLLHDLDPIDELGVDTELGGPQDLSSLLNFDEEDLQDHYSAGLEIPMDDLTELNMF